MGVSRWGLKPNAIDTRQVAQGQHADTDDMRKKDFEEHEVPVEVNIEDTDAFGIVFYPNYIKYIERAIQSSLTSMIGDKWQRGSFGLIPRVIEIDEMRMRSPAVLGESLTVESKVVEVDGYRVIDNIEIKNAVDGTTHVTAKVSWGMYQKEGALSKPPSALDMFATPVSQSAMLPMILPGLPPQIFHAGGRPVGAAASYAAQPRSVYHEDEASRKRKVGSNLCVKSFEVPLEDIDSMGVVSNFAFMKYFTRASSFMFGGPKALSRMIDEGTSLVVGRIEELSFDPGYSSKAELGDQLELRTYCKPRGKSGVQWDNWIEIWRVGGDEDDALIASCLKVLVTVDNATMKPKRTDEWIWDIIESYPHVSDEDLPKY